jgi:N-acetylglucosaminyldiphosphoundecaprenol N-acetyl-beta-D-mannosaminyltransferase
MNRAESDGAMPLKKRDLVCILGLPIDVIDMQSTLARVRQAARTGERLFISTPNLNFLMAAHADPDFRESVLQSHLSLADGVSLLAVARLMGAPLPGRVSGADLFQELWASQEQPPVKVFFLGGPPGAARLAAERVNERGGGVRCVGFDEAGFGDVESMSNQALIDRINATGAEFVVVSLGAKKGQAWIMRNHHRLHAPVISHLGAVVNFTAGTIQRAPRWMQQISLEWLWRAMTESGLTRRYWDDGRALFRVLIGQVLPGAFHERLVRLQGREPAGLEELPLVDSVRQLRLSGFWRHEDALRLRDVLSSDLSSDVQVDAQHVLWLDVHAIGALAGHHGRVRAAGGRGLVITGIKPALSRQIRRDGAAYLLEHPNE